jgi:hypothetical protein
MNGYQTATKNGFTSQLKCVYYKYALKKHHTLKSRNKVRVVIHNVIGTFSNFCINKQGWPSEYDIYTYSNVAQTQ